MTRTHQTCDCCVARFASLHHYQICSGSCFITCVARFCLFSSFSQNHDFLGVFVIFLCKEFTHPDSFKFWLVTGNWTFSWLQLQFFQTQIYCLTKYMRSLCLKIHWTSLVRWPLNQLLIQVQTLTMNCIVCVSWNLHLCLQSTANQLTPLDSASRLQQLSFSQALRRTCEKDASGGMWSALSSRIRRPRSLHQSLVW